MVLRELFVKLGLNIDEASFAKGELAAEVVKAGLEKLVDTAKEAIDTVKEHIAETLEYVDSLDKTSQSIGVETRALQEYQFVAGLAGVASEEMNIAVMHLARSLQAAKKGSEEQSEAFKKLGIRATDSHGKLRSIDDVLTAAADKFQKMPDGAEKTALAMDLFGRSGARMIPLLNQGSEGLAKMRAEAQELGGVIGEDAVKAGAELHDELEKLEYVGKSLWRSAIGPLLPAMKELVHRFVEWRKANAAVMAQTIRKYIGGAIVAINKLGDAFAFLIRNATAIKAIVVTGLVVGFAQVSNAAVLAAAKTTAAWIAAALPFIALAALVAGILLVFDDIRVYQKGGKSLYGRFKNEIESWLKPRDQDPWFVVAIKDFVRLLDDAIKLIDEFYEATGRVNPRTVDKRAGIGDKAIRQRADNQTLETARRRVAAGLELTGEEQAALKRSNVTPEAFVQKYGAKGPLQPPTAQQTQAAAPPTLYVPPAPAAPSPLIGGAPVNINVYPTPGMSEEQVGTIAAQKVQEHWDTQMENAAAEVGP